MFADIFGFWLTAVFLAVHWFAVNFVFIPQVRENYIPYEYRPFSPIGDFKYLAIRLGLVLILVASFVSYGISLAWLGYGLGGHENFHVVLAVLAGSYVVFSVVRIMSYPMPDVLRIMAKRFLVKRFRH